MSKFEGLRKNRAGETFTEQPLKHLEIQNVELPVPDATAAARKSRKPGGMAKSDPRNKEFSQLTVYIPAARHRKVKAATVLEGVELSALVAELLAEWTDKRN